VEHVLKASEHRPVVRIGDTVRRRLYPWSDAVHSLLRHLEHVGFPYSPRFLGIDDEGREVLTFIEGTTGLDGYVEGVERGSDVWAMVASDAGLEHFARLLRAYHDAVADFVPAVDAEWSTGHDVLQPGQILLHNDFAPWSVVWDDHGVPVGILDWDFAAPGPAIDDVAYALGSSVPCCSDEDAMRWRRFDAPPDRRARIERFASAYGLASTDGLVDAMLRRQRAFAVGHESAVQARIDWTEANRALLE
jgi:hypothetical protein